LDARLIPAVRKPVVVLHDLPPSLRRSARNATGPSGYAVTTNAESDPSSGTYTTCRYRPAALCPRAIRAPSLPAQSSNGASRSSLTSSSVTP
jgi:hypothetical protein